ncbi:MAG: vitamin K epoxide reductase family protein, partial [Bacteroidota bacterium]
RHVIHHPDARVFGIPNSLLGVGYYLMALSVSDGLDFPIALLFLKFASWAAVLLAVYLVYSLFVRVKTRCPLCLLSHGINLVIAIIVTFWY